MLGQSDGIERLLDWTARLREDMTAMPWAEPPNQPTTFDRRDEQECEEFAAMFSTVRCTACGHVQNVLRSAL